jgi:hypothetical protein
MLSGRLVSDTIESKMIAGMLPRKYNLIAPRI